MRISAKLHTEDERLHADFHATVQVGGGLSLGHALMWDKQGRLAVQVAEEAEADNTLPITAAAVYAELGNIEVLLGIKGASAAVPEALPRGRAVFCG